jgi:hypothetical protein
MRYVGASDVDVDGVQITSLADGSANDDAQTVGQSVVIAHQDGVRTARTIYVQLSGESDPSSPEEGDIRILES